MTAHVAARNPSSSRWKPSGGARPLAFAGAVLAGLLACGFVAARLFDPPGRALLSLALQHGSVAAVFFVLAGVCRGAVAHLLLFAAATSYAIAVQAHTLSMAVISLPADALLRLLGNRNDALAVLQQAHVSGPEVLALVALFAVEVAALAVLYRRGLRGAPSLGRLRWTSAAAAALVAAFVAEQGLARNSDEYLGRQARLPGYYRLFSGDIESLTFIADRAPDERPDGTVDRVTGARNPRNVVLIMLESFRYDVLGPALTPHLHAAAGESLFFTNAYAASSITSRVWNALLFDRPPHTFLRDREAFEAGAGSARRGAFPVRVLKRAGYQVMVSMGCKFDWHRFRERFEGEQGLMDRFFSSHPGHNNARHVADDRATDEIVRWLGEPGLKKPFFLLTHLDSTHYYYFFHKAKAVARPYAETVSAPRLMARSPKSLELLFNRYKNAVAQVDFNVGRILEAVEQAGLSGDTAVVIIADHGEAFEPGQVGHLQVNEATKRVPLLMRLPGVAPARVERLVTGADVFPTLFDYLGLQALDRSILLGRSAQSDPPRRSVLTLDGSMRQAHLTFPELTVVFDLVSVEERTLSFSPISVLGPDGAPLSGWRKLLPTIPWQSELRQDLDHGYAVVTE